MIYELRVWVPWPARAPSWPRQPIAAACRPRSSRARGCLKRSPVMLPIPGTSKVSHLEDNLAAVSLKLTDDEFAAL